ncbi:DUF4421 family protein [Winogradskyella aurantiaca]|uniref:DUF4421 family protein n=1 Tax=Winogradskyella aurantiaca TaxID=2219558 RepID=UPI0013009D19|nr:DUF4421 family protein [Winogradskyella aurantiaca]
MGRSGLNRINKNFFFSGLIMFVVLWSYSQEMRPYDLEMQAKHAEKKGYDPTYRVNYFENIIIRATYTNNLNNLQFLDTANGNAVDLRPAAENLLGVSVDYKWIAIGVSYAPQFLITTADQELQNSSESLKLNLNFFYSDQWRQELNYTYNRGFKVSSNFDLREQDIIRLQNIELQVIQGSTYFIANKNYSFRAHYAQTERQLRSAGSLIPKIYYGYSIFRPTIGNFSETDQTTEVESFDFIGSVGYLYTFVHNQKWIATGGLHPGIGYNNSSYEYNNDKEDIFNSVSFTFKGEVTLGYNSYRWFWGVNGFWQNFNNSNNQNIQLNRDTLFVMAYMGYRFNDNKPMRKFFGWFEDTFGF